MQDNWDGISLDGDPHLVLGKKKPSKKIEVGSVPVGKKLFAHFRERAQSALQRLAEASPRDYQPTASLDGKDEYFNIPLDSLPTQFSEAEAAAKKGRVSAVDRRSEEGVEVEIKEETNPDRTAALVSALSRVGSIDQIPRSKVGNFKSIFYSIAFQQSDESWVHFIKKSSPTSIFQPHRLWGIYREELEPVEQPDLLIYQDFDVILGRENMAAFSSFPLQVLFTDIGLMMSAVPAYVSKIESAFNDVPLSREAASVLLRIGQKKVSVASRIYRIAEKMEGIQMTVSSISDILNRHGVDRDQFISPSGEVELTDKNVDIFLDVLEGRYYEDDLTGEARRADKYSRRR